MNQVLTRLLYTMLATSCVWAPASAHAEVVSTSNDLQSNPRLQAFLWSPPVNLALFQLGQEQDKQLNLQSTCQSEYEVKPTSLMILSPIDLPSNKQTPSTGAWLYRYEFTRCGETKVYNALFSVNPTTGIVEREAYIPGSSMAGPLLMREALGSAISSATNRSNMQSCKNVDVFDMQVTKAPSAVQANGKLLNGAWRETWTMKVCGKTVEVPITFTPDVISGNTSFSIDQL
jgi:hypothetical protein